MVSQSNNILNEGSDTLQRAVRRPGDARTRRWLLAESFVPGPEVAVEGLLRDGELEVLAPFHKPDPLDGPYFEETIYVTPSRLAPAVQVEIARVTADAAAALGLAEGPVHAELRVTPDPTGDRIRVIDVAARSIGGLCARALRFGAGISLEEVIMRHALGLPLDDVRREGAARGVMMLPIPATGTLRAVHGQDAARASPGVVGLEVSIGRNRHALDRRAQRARREAKPQAGPEARPAQ